MSGPQGRSDAGLPVGNTRTSETPVDALLRPGLLLLSFNGLLLLWLLLRPASGTVVVAVDNVAQFTGPLLMLLLLARGLEVRALPMGHSPAGVRTRRRWVPALLACGVASYCIGQIVFTYYEQVLHRPAPFPSWADLGYLSLYPFLLSAVLLLPARPLAVVARLRLAVDGLIILVAVASYSWYFILVPTMATSDDSVVVKAVTVAYPLCDLLVFCSVLVLWARLGQGAPQPATGLLTAAFAVIVGTDSIWQFQQLHDIYATGSLLDMGWPVGYMTIVLAAHTLRTQVVPDQQEQGTVAELSPASAPSLLRALLPFGAALAIAALALYASRTPGLSYGAISGIYVGAVLLAALVLLRQASTIFENRQLYRYLDTAYTAQGHRLASRVAELEWLRDVTRQVTAARSLREVLDAAYRGIRAGLGYDRVGINLWDLDDGIFEDWVGTDTAGRQTWPEDRQIPLGPDSPIWRFPGMAAMVRGEALYFTRAAYQECPPELRYLYDGEPTDSLLVALRGTDRTVGMISVDNLISGRPIAEGDAAPLLALANQLGLAVERAGLSEAQRARAEESEAMARVGEALARTLEPEQPYEVIFQQASAMLPCDHVEISLFQDGWLVIVANTGDPCVPVPSRVMRLEDAMVARDTEGGVPKYFADTADVHGWRDMPPWIGPHRLRSLIAIPLLIDGVVRGSFTVASFTPQMYTAHHIGLAAAFGDRAEQALRNAQLYAAEQERARAAEELARLRSGFVASVSHELRTPLTAILGYAELLEDRWDRIGDDQRLATVRKIALAANRQRRMVEDLLLLGRIEAGSLTVMLGAVALGTLVRRAAEEVQAGYRGQRIDLDGPAELVVLADPDRTVQVLINLLDNAAKYSPEGCPIEVRWDGQGTEGLACVRVRDMGQGIPEYGRAALFTRFGRLPGSKARAGRVGTGLGLYLSRQFATMMGGTLELEATAASGSTFVLCLPLAPVGRAEPSAAPGAPGLGAVACD